MSDRSDTELLFRAGRGDAAAFEALYMRHRDFVHRVAWRFCRDESETLDVLQDVFSGLLRQASRIRLTGRLTTYLYPAIRNAVATRRRKDRPLKFGEVPERLEVADRIPENLAPELHAALESLSESHREALLLRAVDGLSMDEIGAALGIPSGTVKSRLHHAIQTLRGQPALQRLWEP
ncbi:ECF RNA polymerase sigma factor SigE [Phycisphaerales bacterium]|nr:ECF RNA polymerase sigma factor SigE [Phycisphaerales bacterium]